jgi:glycine cleavage system H protein
MNVPQDLRYTKDHEWVRDEGDGVVAIGITDYAQGSLGDVTYVDLPKPGRRFAAGDTFGVVESVKAASDLYMPLAGEVVESNEALQNAPETVNQAPYEGAWMVRIKADASDDFAKLLSPEDYAKLLS